MSLRQVEGVMYVGIDPGVGGAIACIYPDGEAMVYDCPTREEEHVREGKRRVFRRIDPQRAAMTMAYLVKTGAGGVAGGVLRGGREDGGGAGVAATEWGALGGAYWQVRGDAVVAIERASVRPQEGAGSALTTGEGYGVWRGICGALRGSERLVTPVTWKRALGLVSGADKEDSRALALSLFPTLGSALARKKDHGRAEALLIAEWSRRQGPLQELPLKERLGL